MDEKSHLRNVPINKAQSIKVCFFSSDTVTPSPRGDWQYMIIIQWLLLKLTCPSIQAPFSRKVAISDRDDGSTNYEERKLIDYNIFKLNMCQPCGFWYRLFKCSWNVSGLNTSSYQAGGRSLAVANLNWYSVAILRMDQKPWQKEWLNRFEVCLQEHDFHYEISCIRMVRYFLDCKYNPIMQLVFIIIHMINTFIIIYTGVWL